MADVTVGTVITAADGTDTVVSNIYPQGELDIYAITFEDGRVVECCADHLWKVFHRDWADGFRVVTLKEIERKIKLKSAPKRLYVPLMTPANTAPNNLPIAPYLLGILLGDGHLGKDCVRVSTADEFILDQILPLLPTSVGINHLKKYDYSLSSPRGKCNALLDALRALGLAGKGSLDKFIPVVYKESSVDQKWQLLQGLMDSDGSVSCNGSFEYSTISTDLAFGVQQLVWSLGGICKVTSRTTYYTHKGEKKAGKLSYRVSMRVSDPTKVVRLPRKFRNVPKNYQYSNLKLRIKSVEFVGTKESQCIQIEHPDHLYLTDNFVVTHNTYVPSRIYAEMLVQGKISKIYVARPNVAKHKHRNGFLPGTVEEKTAPWLVPIFEGMKDAMSKGDFEKFRKNGAIEEVPFEFIQGRTFRDAACIVDEAENLDMEDLYITLTRQGEGLHMVLCGDVAQARIPDSGLQAVADVAKLPHMESTDVIEFSTCDIVRSRQARQWAEAFTDLLKPNYLPFTPKRGIDGAPESGQSLPRFVTGQ